MMYAATNARLIKGFSPSSESHEIAHLQFTDDTILLCDAEEEQLRNIKGILLCFEAFSGFRANLFKSELIGLELKKAIYKVWQTLLGAKQGCFPQHIWDCHFAMERHPNLYGCRCLRG
eukprot:TRINITY_DN48445_c0_g1_i2.p1 TRINITY_DN48445_c0_g1~~TRINITY_DN48445_c0_g1_i2.p1  ORF type:complete len:118 (-),score=12.02 TRINITY_DN48445_c0_g1_i2:125-478(-)